MFMTGTAKGPEPGSEYCFEASAEDAGSRLDTFLAARMSALPDGMTRARVQRLVDEGQVRLDGAVARSSARLKPGSVARVRVPAPRPSGVLPEKIPLQVLHEDADVIVVDKPAGLAVHPGAGRASGTLVNALLARTPLASVGDVLRPGIVHRLDKDTSGALVAAKTDLAHQSLAKQFHDRTVERAYVALCWGRFPGMLTAEERIGRDPKERKRFAAFPKTEETGRRAVTHARLTEVLGPASLVECRLETGRTHQIRVHLAHHGFPLVGDPVLPIGRRVRRAAQPPVDLIRNVLVSEDRLVVPMQIQLVRSRVVVCLPDAAAGEQFGGHADSPLKDWSRLGRRKKLVSRSVHPPARQSRYR